MEAQKQRQPERPFPWSLPRQVEAVFLAELKHVLEVLLWRADEIEWYAGALAKQSAGTTETWPRRRSRGVSLETKLVGAVEAFLAGWARASLILHPTRGSKARGEHLCHLLGIDRFGDSKFSSRTFRDGWMHLDEDIEQWARERAGRIASGAVAGVGVPWHELTQVGAIRVVELDRLAIALPCRGITLLEPFFEDAKDLLDRIHSVQGDRRWLTHRGVNAAVVLWTRQGDEWEARTLDIEPQITVTAQKRTQLESDFRSRVDERLDAV